MREGFLSIFLAAQLINPARSTHVVKTAHEQTTVLLHFFETILP